MTNIPNVNDQVDQWRSVMFLYDSALKRVNTKIEILNNEFVNRYDYNPIVPQRYCRNPYNLLLYIGYLPDCPDDIQPGRCDRPSREGLYQESKAQWL